MTREERDAIRARCDAATPGPWFVREGKSFGVQSEGLNIASCFRKENEHFIAHARGDIPSLLDALNKAEAHSNYLEAQRNEWMKARDVVSTARDHWRSRCEALEQMLKDKKVEE